MLHPLPPSGFVATHPLGRLMCCVLSGRDLRSTGGARIAYDITRRCRSKSRPSPDNYPEGGQDATTPRKMRCGLCWDIRPKSRRYFALLRRPTSN